MPKPEEADVTEAEAADHEPWRVCGLRGREVCRGQSHDGGLLSAPGKHLGEELLVTCDGCLRCAGAVLLRIMS